MLGKSRCILYSDEVIKKINIVIIYIDIYLDETTTMIFFGQHIYIFIFEVFCVYDKKSYSPFFRICTDSYFKERF